MAQLSCNKCFLCTKGNGDLYCRDCERFLCKTCKPVHDLIPLTQHHTVIDANQEGRLVFKPKPVCGDHKKEYVYYCNKCDCLICSDCLISVHSGHPCCDYMTIVDRRRQNVKEIIGTLKAKVQVLEDSLNTIKNNTLPQINSATDDFDKKMNAVTNEIECVIDRVKNIYRTTASDYQSTETEKLTKIRANLERVQNEYRNVLLKFEHILLEQHGVTFILEQNAIQLELTNLDEIPEIPTADQIPNFSADSFTDQIIDELQNKFNIRQFKEKTEEIRKLTDKLEEAEHNIGQKELQIARLTKEKSAEITKLNATLQQEKTKLSKLKKDQERERQCTIDLEQKLKAEQSNLKEQIDKCAREIDEKKRIEQELLRTRESLQKIMIQYQSNIPPCAEHADVGFKQMNSRKPSVKSQKSELLEDAQTTGTQEKFSVGPVTLPHYSHLNQNRQHGQSSPNLTQTKKISKPNDNFAKVISLPLSELHLNMLKFFCPDSKIFFGNWEWVDGILMRSLQPQEAESDLRVAFESQKALIQSLCNMEVISSVEISDEILNQIQKNVREAGEIYCYCSSDKKTLTLYGISYEKLGAGKHMAEIALGLKQQNKGRRNRVFYTDIESNTTRISDSIVNRTLDQSLNRTVGFSKFMSASYSPLLEKTFKTVEGIIVKVYVGNILRLDVDCIVNAANETLSHGGGVARVIAEEAGCDFEKESDEYVRTYGQIPVGTCCTTSSGRLKYKCVIHAVGPKWHMYSDKRHCCLDLKKAVESCFYEAEINNMTSIALPSISAGYTSSMTPSVIDESEEPLLNTKLPIACRIIRRYHYEPEDLYCSRLRKRDAIKLAFDKGIFGVPTDVCCSEYCNAVEDFSRNNGYKTCLKEIHFIDKDESLITIIQNAFGQRMTSGYMYK